MALILVLMVNMLCEQQPVMVIWKWLSFWSRKNSRKIPTNQNMSQNCGRYVQLSSNITQQASATPTQIQMNLVDAVQGVKVRDGTDVVVTKRGVYFVVAAPQVGTSGSGPSHADFWLRLNGKDVSNSNVRIQFNSSDSKDVIVAQAILELDGCDSLSVLFTGSNGTYIEAIKPDNEPLIPSIIFSLYRIA